MNATVSCPVSWLRRLFIGIWLAALGLSGAWAQTPAERCPSGVEWTDEVVAKAIGLSESRLTVLKSARVLTNADVCTMPKKRLDRAIWRSVNPKPDNPGQWAKFRALQQSDESGTVKPDGLIRALQQRNDILQRAAQAGTLAQPIAGIGPGQWTSLGPGNIGGRVRAIAIHPTTAGTMWIGSVSGGIWKTVNDGASWAPVNDFAGNLSITSLVISHANANVMYAATGEGFFNVDAVRGAGIFRSTDGGTTWTQLPSTNPVLGAQWYFVNRIAMHPTNASILLAATNNGLYRSTDGGTTWSLRNGGDRVLDVQFNPLDGSRAVMGGSDLLMFSDDGGLSWFDSNVVPTGRAEVAYSRQNGVVYASVDMAAGRIYRSTDNGATWTLRSTPGHLGLQGFYDNTIWVDPVNSNHVIFGGIDLYRSTNGGASWVQISQWFREEEGSPHADHHVIVSAPGYNGTTNRTIYFGNDGGVYKAQDINAVTSPVTGWTELNNGLGITQFYSGAGHTGLNGRIIGGTQDNGSLRNAPTGTNWSEVFGGDGGASAIDPTNGNFIYGEYIYLQIHRSTNGGATQAEYIWPGIGDANNPDRSNFISPFVLDPNNPNTMIAGGQSVWRSTNVKAATPTWTSIMGVVAGGGEPSLTSALTVTPGNSAIIWVGKNGGRLYKTTNGTAATPTWTEVGAGTLPTGRMLLSIHVDTSNANVVYASFGGYSRGNLWKTSNGGTTWTNIGATLPESPIRSVTTSPLNPNRVYAATEVGVFASENGGTTWGTTNDGPANVSVDQLFWIDPNTLGVATHGRGMFKTTVAGGPSFRLSAVVYTVSEGTASLTIPVTRSLTTGTASVRYATANGTATGGADYTATAGTLNFADGVGTQNIVVPILDDATTEAAENFSVTLSSPVNGVLGTPVTATVTITDNDGATVRLGAAAYTVAETGPSITIPVTRSSTVDTASVSYATGNGSAAAGADYTATTGTLNFTAGVATLNIVVPILDDAVPEPAETFTVSLSAPVNLVVAAPSVATVTITDNDLPTVRLGAAAYSVGEATASLSIPVTRTSSTGTTTVSYATANGTATAGADYTARSGTLSFAAGVSTLNIVVPILNDAVREANETFTVTLSAPTGATLGAPAAATVSIVDNDVPQTLTVGLAGGGFGTVTSTPAGIHCGATCSATFEPETVVTMNTVVPFGSSFNGWTGACTGRGPCQVTMSEARSLTATFLQNAQTQPLSLSFSGSGRVTSVPAAVDCTAFCLTRFETGSTVTLNAAPAAGQRFLGWAGACTGTGSCVLTMNALKNVTAQFGP